MLDDIATALVITRREIRDQMRDWRIIFPVLGLTIFFPFLMNFTAGQMVNFVREYGGSILTERMVPFLLMIVGFFPISVSMVIALETFVGEKERGSIEPLLNTPLKDWQLYLGKLLSATVPPLFASYLGMAVYIGGLLITDIPLPPPDLLFQIIVLTTVQAFMMVSGSVAVSSQATSVRAANLLASFIIIPSAFLIQGESVVMFWGDYSTLWWAVLGLLVLSILLVRVGLSHFAREELLGREIDVLNLRWGWSVFKTTFSGGARNIFAWYKIVIPDAVSRLLVPAAVVTALALFSVWYGYALISRLDLPMFTDEVQNITTRLEEMTTGWGSFPVEPLLSIFWQNVRVLLLALLLGAFSFGVLGVFPIMATMGILGLIMGVMVQSGVSAEQFLFAFILPHGLIEIPAVILSTASILRAGAILAAPSPHKTIGEVWISSLAEWAKIMFGLVLPLLFIAAAVEAWLTPHLALYLLR
ncbi:MAG: stage II sporulation protein M [Anaerolineaceae bacterium]